MKKQWTLLLLAALLLASCAEGTAQTPADSAKNSDTAPAQSETEALTEDIKAPEIEAMDAGGREFTFLARSKESGYLFPYAEISSDGENGDAINDAIFRRNNKINEKYNVKITAVEVPGSGGATEYLRKAVSSNEANYDVALQMIAYILPQAAEGYFYEISDIPHIDTEKPWWMSSVLADTSIGGRNYFVPGDIDLSALNGVGIVYFNKKTAAKLDLENLYDIVRAGDWTLDKMISCCHNMTEDLNGDGVFNGEDAFGFTCNAFVWQPFFFGTDNLMIRKNKEDIPEISWSSEKNINALMKIQKLLNDKKSTILVNQFPELKKDGGWGQASIDMFTGDRALFWVEIIYGVPQLRNMDTDFGVLPMPKYDDAQENYTSYIHPSHSSAVIVPVTNNDLDLTGRILEDMSYQSYMNLRPAFYDTTLKGKSMRDEDSAQMLDIIYKNIRVDLALAMGLSVDNEMRTAMIENRTEFASILEAQTAKNEAILNDYVSRLTSLE